VLILGDFKSFAPEVLIPVDLKSFIISEMRGVEDFLEVLILGDLMPAMPKNGWI
jgi:hypothetical protein